MTPASPEPLPVWILLGLTATTGVVDAVSVLGLGHVFTANMTGNIVFLGFAIAGSPGFSAIRSGIALIGFLAGAVGGGRLAVNMASQPSSRWKMYALGLEGLLLACAAIASLWLVSSYIDWVVIGLTALAMGARNATIRKIGLPDLTTTVLTLTIAGLAADSSLAGGDNPRWRRRISSIS